MLEANARNSVLSVAEPGRREELPAGALATSRKYGVLVVDDQADLRAMLRIALGEKKVLPCGWQRTAGKPLTCTGATIR